MNRYLEQRWAALASLYCSEKVSVLQEKLTTSYQEAHRKYHTFAHLEHFFREFDTVSLTTLDEAAEWAIWYHDIVYKPGKHDNEAKSAKHLCQDLEGLSVDKDIINRSVKLIMATQKHQSNDSNSWHFLDADMAILGQSRTAYRTYAEQVREEFARVPDFLYRRGRKKFLSSTLAQPKIFYSDHFYHLYEQQARENLKWEIDAS